jgi:cell shape-determining protein MreC
MAFRIEDHIIGKVYDLTQENMNTMISDIERLKTENTKLKQHLIDFQTRYSESLAENARLREALESISGICNYEDEPSKGDAGNIAREALKGGEL